METFKKMWLVLIGFLSKKIETPEVTAHISNIEEDPQQRVFRLQKEQKNAAEQAAKDQKWQKERENEEKEEQRIKNLQIQYSKEISCARELLRRDYVPLSAILLNGGIPRGYTLIKRKQKIFETSQEMGTMRLAEVGIDEKSWSESTDYILISQSLSDILSNLISLSTEKLQEMPSIIQNIFYSEYEHKGQLHVEGPMYRQVINKTRNKYFVLTESYIEKLIKDIDKE